MKSLVVAGLTAALSASLVLPGAAYAAQGHNSGPVAKGVHTDGTGVSGWAVVGSDGTIARKLNAKSASHLDVGEYEVLFNSNVRGCAYTGTVGLPGSSGSSDPGYMTVVGRASNSKGVYIETFDSTGARADLGFHLLVSC